MEAAPGLHEIGRLDDVIERILMHPLKTPDARAEFFNGHLLKDFYDGIANLKHHTANPALGFIRATAFLVKARADATHRSERAFNVANHLGERDFVKIGRAHV